MNCAISFYFHIYLMQHTYTVRFDVTVNLKNFWELNKPAFLVQLCWVLTHYQVRVPPITNSPPMPGGGREGPRTRWRRQWNFLWASLKEWRLLCSSARTAWAQQRALGPLVVHSCWLAGHTHTCAAALWLEPAQLGPSLLNRSSQGKRDMKRY